MAVTKATAAQAVPHQPLQQDEARPAPRPAAEPVKALTVKVKESLYWRMSDHCQEQGRATGRRLTHQDFAVEAMEFYLKHLGR
jgi:hypothetical protein